MVNGLWLSLRNLSLWFSIFLDDFEHTDFHTENVKKSRKSISNKFRIAEPVNVYLLKRNRRSRWEICTKWTIKTSGRHQWHIQLSLVLNSNIFHTFLTFLTIVDFEQVNVCWYPLQVLCRIAVLRNFAKLTWKHLQRRLLFTKFAGLDNSRFIALSKYCLWEASNCGKFRIKGTHCLLQDPRNVVFYAIHYFF